MGNSLKLTNSVKQNHSQEANNFLASQEILQFMELEGVSSWLQEPTGCYHFETYE
jgi:hypothetical protein